jgi:hypothetical protein
MSSPIPPSEPSNPGEVEPIPAEQARAILEAAMREKLGDDWRDEDSGWLWVTGHDYMARVTRGRKNVDFYVDLLGSVSVTEKEINPGQDSGRLLAWFFLGLSIAIAFLIARIVGWL